MCVCVFNMCFSTGKLARPQGEGGLGFLGGFSITRGVELAPSKKGGGAVSSRVRGWLLLSVEHGTVYISWVNSHYISCSLTVAEVAANNRDDEDAKQDGATAGHPGQAEAQPVQREEEEEHEEDVGV